jgi:hypothetical protein
MYKYILVDVGWNNRRLVRIDSSAYNVNDIASRFRSKGYTVREVCDPPSERTRRRWIKQGKCRAICGCWIDTLPGQRCPKHNTMSWLTAVYTLKVNK